MLLIKFSRDTTYSVHNEFDTHDLTHHEMK